MFLQPAHTVCSSSVSSRAGSKLPCDLDLSLWLLADDVTLPFPRLGRRGPLPSSSELLRCWAQSARHERTDQALAEYLQRAPRRSRDMCEQLSHREPLLRCFCTSQLLPSAGLRL